MPTQAEQAGLTEVVAILPPDVAQLEPHCGKYCRIRNTGDHYWWRIWGHCTTNEMTASCVFGVGDVIRHITQRECINPHSSVEIHILGQCSPDVAWVEPTEGALAPWFSESCQIHSEEGWWNAWGEGYAIQRENAHTFKVFELIDRIERRIFPTASGTMVHILRQVTPTTAINILGRQLSEMLKASPTDPALRTMVLAKVLVPIPDEAITFDQIKEWLETKVKSPATRRPVPPLGADNLVVPVVASRLVTGTCSYRERQLAEGDFELSREDVLQACRNAPDLEHALDAVGDLLEEAISDSDPDFETHGDIDHSDYEEGDTDNNNREYNMREQLIPWLRCYAPDVLARLEEGTGEDE